MSFADRFLARAESHGQVCVGIDPHPELLTQWGLPVNAEGLKQFSSRCVDALRDTACVVKPQVAFYEAHGSAGLAVLEQTIADLRAAGVLVIADAKRGDIGSTMKGYASAWLGEDSPLRSDAVTVSPWLGFDSLEPAFQAADAVDAGVIVLAATSNPEAATVQTATLRRGGEAARREVILAQDIIDRVAARNAAYCAQHGTAGGNLGVVVGATVTLDLDLDEVGGMILMPGVGAQGGTMADARRIAGAAEQWMSPNVSRGVLGQGPDVADLRSAVRRVNADLAR